MVYRVVNTVWDKTLNKKGYERGWVCEYCKEVTATIYIPTSHDHTDESVEMCTCGQGKSFQEVWPTVTKNICPNYPMEWYRRYFA